MAMHGFAGELAHDNWCMGTAAAGVAVYRALGGGCTLCRPPKRSYHAPLLPFHLQRSAVQLCSRRSPIRVACAAPSWSSGFFTNPIQSIDTSVLSATAQASFKLLFLCAVVAWMSHRNMLPPETSRVLSQVSFSLTIPATLIVSTTQTLSSSYDPLSLLAVPLVVLLQVVLGAVMGRVAAAAVAGKLPLTRALLGWKELHPTESAAAIAAIAAAALRVPAAAEALIPHNQKPPSGLSQLVQLSCTFGSTLMLPLLFISSTLPADTAVTAVGYTSLFHAAWSPLLWVIGYHMLTAAGRSSRESMSKARRMCLSRWPVIRLLQGLITRLFSSGDAAATSPGGTSSSSSSTSSSGSRGSRFGQSADILIARQVTPGASGGSSGGRPVFAVPTSSQEEEDPYQSPAEALVKRVWRGLNLMAVAVLGQGAVKQLCNALNPPVVAVVAGVLLGLAPTGGFLTDPTAGPAFIAAHAPPGFISWELGVLLGAVSSCWGALVLLSETTLAVSALVLASSLFGSPSGPASSTGSTGPSSQQKDQEGWSEGGAVAGSASRVEVVGADGSTLMAAEGEQLTAEEEGLAGGSSPVNVTYRGAESPDAASETVLDQMRPRGMWEWRLLVAVSIVRFVAMPVVCTGVVLGAAALGWLPANRACLFALLVQGAMPPAQDLVLMMQLQPGTAKLATAAARLFLQLYVVAVVPVTLWVSAFASWTSGF